MKPEYFLKDDEFVIKNYNSARPFASFLPGIAGLYGKPLWAFYVNRGQCMASFGTRDKDGAIMEFYPANVAYRRITLEGFRTFIKLKNTRDENKIYEPFQLHGYANHAVPVQTLYISPHEFRIEEVSRKHSLKVEVIYFTIPQENFPALARILRIENLSSKKRELEIIDGMPKICPFGVNQFFMKHMSRTIEAWMEIEGISAKLPFYKLRVHAADVSNVEYIKSGNFYLSITNRDKRPDIIVDPAIVFGNFKDFTYPGELVKDSFKMPRNQGGKNTTPCAFSHSRLSIPPRANWSLFSLSGYAESRALLYSISSKLNRKFFESKRSQNKQEIEKISSSISVYSGIKTLDAYTNQTNLDNTLRGGYPIPVEDGIKAIYVFNRKHGDLERDYNHFVLKPEFYSQGNGNFRDTNQNRRNSVWIRPSIGAKDIRDFYNLLQLDGFNPLIIKGDVFSVANDNRKEDIIKKYFYRKDRKTAMTFLSGEFALGDFMQYLENKKLKKSKKRCLKDVIRSVRCRIDAAPGEGYWIDHWTYNLDLIESYIGLFPEDVEHLFFEEKNFMFFDNPYLVKPRSERYIKDASGTLRQYDSVFFDKEKQRLINLRKTNQYWVRTKTGKGQIYRCTLAAKILILICNKIASIDAAGRGIEMEADKPGWCDSLNGLPGIMGSSISESAELLRLIEFFQKVLKNTNHISVDLPREAVNFLRGLVKALGRNLKGFSPEANHRYWDVSNTLKERYRKKVALGIQGQERKMGETEITEFLKLSERKLRKGIAKEWNRKGVPYTYFISEAKTFTKDNKVRRFKLRPMPTFLEGPVHLLKIVRDKAHAATLYRNIRRSKLYDRKLKMYRLNTSLEGESLEIGRSRVFTPGWLENESIWMHMEYKFLLEVLRKGLYKEFYEDFKTVLVPFCDPKVYGKSILENSSFIVSSAFLNKSLHGAGFVARLTGATAEFLHMLRIMNLGENPFSIMEGNLIFKPVPVLHKMLFSNKDRGVEFNFKDGKQSVKIPKNSYGFNIFENTLIVYNNPKARNTYGRNRVKPIRFTVHRSNTKDVIIEGPYLGEPYSRELRNGQIKRLDILLK